MTETFFAALGGWVLAGILAITAYLERRDAQKHEVLLQALEYLTGGSQKRSVGVALIEGLWEKGHPFYRVLLPALINQSVYLLLETESRDGRHQFHNWLRIMDLILRVPREPELFEQYCDISNALYQHIEAKEPLPRGLDIGKQAAQIWFEKINEHAGIGSAA